LALRAKLKSNTVSQMPMVNIIRIKPTWERDEVT